MGTTKSHCGRHRFPVLIRGGRDASGKLKMHLSNSYPRNWENLLLTPTVFLTKPSCALVLLSVNSAHLNLRRLQVSTHRGAVARVGAACSESGLIMCIYRTRSIKTGLLSSLNELFQMLFQILKSSRKQQPAWQFLTVWPTSPLLLKRERAPLWLWVLSSFLWSDNCGNMLLFYNSI